MKEIVRKSLIKDIKRTFDILEHKEAKDVEELRKLSDHTIGDVALYKNLDAVSLAVLIYSIYKVLPCIKPEDYKDLVDNLKLSHKKLSDKKFGAYNRYLSKCFNVVKKCNAAVKTHINDVFHAAKLKKGSTLLAHGLSVSRAAEVMGISRWDLQEYTGKTRQFEFGPEKVRATKRIQMAMELFRDQGESKEHKILFFDAGPIITLTMARMIDILKPLKEKFGGKFYITPAVYKELVEEPITIRRFKFEALQVKKLIKEGVLEIYNNVPNTKVASFTNLSNKLYAADKKWMEVIQAGEMSIVVAALKEKTPIAMDERTMRLLIEDPTSLKTLLERRSRKKVISSQANINKFSSLVKGVVIIRSIELASLAFKLGLFDSYALPGATGKKELLDAILWNAKFNGCAVTENEIEELKAFLLSK
jgi:hypothetical protein